MTPGLYVVSRAPNAQEAHGPDPAGARESAPGPGNPLGLDPLECARFEDELIAELAATGRRVLVIPHVYDLRSEHPALERLANSAGDVVLASWLHPRAALWTLRSAGIDTGAGRSVRCCSMIGFCCAGKCAEAMMAGGSASAGGEAVVDDMSGAVGSRWYPVLDYDLCTACGKCLDFCLFGVYSRGAEGRVCVTCPDNCKPGCPACARVCPAGAIMFPHYTDDSAIAGAPGTPVDTRYVGIVELPGATGESVGGPAADACACASVDGDIQALAQALEDFDEDT